MLELAVVGARLVVAGLIVIGLSGVIAAIFGAAFGKPFVAGDPPGTRYTRSRCADYFEYVPGAHSCEGAATIHHFDEAVDYPLAAGVVGILGLGGLLLFRKRAPRSWKTLPRGFEAVVGALAFGVVH